MRQIYKADESKASDKNTPVDFYGESTGGFIPGMSEEGKHLFFCMAEMYQSSQKDYDAMRSTNVQYAITLIIPDSRPDYIPTAKHKFKVEDELYQDLIFEVDTVAPTKYGEVKIVGVYHAG